MKSKSIKRDYIISLLLGLSCILIVHLVIQTINMQLIIHQFRTLPFEEFKQLREHPPLQQQIITLTVQIVSISSFIIAGMIGAWKMKKSEWLYGGIVGIMWQLFSLTFSLGLLVLWIFFPESVMGGSPGSNPQMFEAFRTREITEIVQGIPFTLFNYSILLTALGGAIVSYLRLLKK